MMDMSGALVQAGANANEIIIPKIDVSGLADYGRGGGGYVQGDVALANETGKFNYDRGRKFEVDAMDNVETVGIAFGRLASEFVRTKVVPEMDAFRFSAYAAEDGINKKQEALASGSDALLALLDAQNKMDEGEVSSDGRVLFITPTLYNLVMNIDSYKSKAVMDSFEQVVKVPQTRFYTAVDLLDGKTENEKAGGYKKADGAADINFMVIQKSAPIQIAKHTVSNVFSPEENQNADAWAFTYRAYGLVDVYENKRGGIYLHYAPTSSGTGGGDAGKGDGE